MQLRRDNAKDEETRERFELSEKTAAARVQQLMEAVVSLRAEVNAMTEQTRPDRAGNEGLDHKA